MPFFSFEPVPFFELKPGPTLYQCFSILKEPPQTEAGDIAMPEDTEDIVQVAEAEEGAEEGLMKDYFAPYEEGEEEEMYKKLYRQGKHRTVVILFEGEVVACPYDEEGPKFKEGTILTPGQKISQEGLVGEKTPEKS